TAAMAILALLARGGSSGGRAATTARHIAFRPKAANKPYRVRLRSGGQAGGSTVSAQVKRVSRSGRTRAPQGPSIPNMNRLKVAYGNADPQVSTTEAQALLPSYPNLKGIISPTTVGISAAAQVLKQTGKAGKVQLTGLGTPNLMRAFVKAGTCKEFALWNVN